MVKVSHSKVQRFDNDVVDGDDDDVDAGNDGDDVDDDSTHQMTNTNAKSAAHCHQMAN